MQRRRLLLLLLVAGLCCVALLNFSSNMPKAQRCRMLAYFRQDQHCDEGAGADASTKLEKVATSAPTPLAPTPLNCDSNHSFPKVVHLLWKDREVPPGLRPFVSSWSQLNKDWQVKVWDDASLQTLLKERLSPVKFEQWQSFPSTVGKMDVARLYLMQLLGGVYSDLDVMCYSCLNALLAQQAPQVTLVLAKEFEGDEQKKVDGLVSNYWIASQANSSAIRYLVDNLPFKANGRWQWPDEKAFEGQDPDPNHNNFDGILNTAGPRYIQRRVFSAPNNISSTINILPGTVWASVHKEKLWEGPPKTGWENQDALKVAIAKFQSFGLHFHAGKWWQGPAHHKFYDEK